MNNENNEFGNVEQTNPEVVPNQALDASSVAPAAETPVVETPVEVTPAPETPVAEAPAVEAAPVAEAPVVTEAPAVETPAVETPGFNAEPVMGETPSVEPTMGAEAPLVSDAPAVGTPAAEQPVLAEEPKKSNKMIIIIGAVVAVVVIGVVLFFVLGKKEEEPKPEPTPTVPEKDNKEEFFALANKYLAAVNELWENDNMVCQNAKKPTEFLKPSQLPDKDKSGWTAYYYVFIDSYSTDEMKLNVDDDTKVNGWIRINKSNGDRYVALSDGTNYLLDKGYEKDIAISTLSKADVITTGNGDNIQYRDGEIFGSSTEGDGWGIGDFKNTRDGDDSNNGIYTSFGKKTGGQTPWCKNAE